jgi:DNA-directed RNA polymerase subunit F
MNSRMASQPYKRAKFSPEAILELTTTLKGKPWKLLQAEILQILNHIPDGIQELRFILEDADLRFKEEQLKGMLSIIHKIMKVGYDDVGQ